LDEIMLAGHVHYNKSIRNRSVIRMITSWNSSAYDKFPLPIISGS